MVQPDRDRVEAQVASVFPKVTLHDSQEYGGSRDAHDMFFESSSRDGDIERPEADGVKAAVISIASIPVKANFQ